MESITSGGALSPWGKQRKGSEIKSEPRTPQPGQNMSKDDDTKKACHALRENTVKFLCFGVGQTGDALVSHGFFSTLHLDCLAAEKTWRPCCLDDRSHTESFIKLMFPCSRTVGANSATRLVDVASRGQNRNLGVASANGGGRDTIA